MKNSLYCLVILAWVPFSVLFAQTEQQARKYTATYNQSALTALADEFHQTFTTQKQRAVAYAQARGLPVRTTLPNGSVAEVQRLTPEGTLVYYVTYNVAAAASTRTNHLHNGGTLGLNLEGQGMTAHVWDGGHARASHQEYDGPGGNNRVTIMDAGSENGVQLNFHAAHVTGTVAASGVQATAKGMAPQTLVHGYMWNDDKAEATTAAANGMLISNHSYGFRSDLAPDYYFGAYIDESRDWDAILFNAPYYLMVVAAGNDGTTNFNGSPLNPSLPQYDKLTGHSTSKNNLVVANAQDALVDAQGNLLGVTINSGSSQGPTDDLRIKPDIAGNGTQLTSTYETGNDAYGTISGTSMASPNVAGSLVLLQQHANMLDGTYLRAATLKGLVLHTADDAGPTGPDAVWGWGLMNTKRAAETLSQASAGEGSLVEELTLSQGQSYVLNVDSDGFQPLLASISWTDPAGTATTDTNSSTPRLVNDLDIRVTQGGTTYTPWKLTGVNTNALGDNLVDPFEHIGISGASGSYTITITHKGSLQGGSQNYTLIVTGLDVACTAATVPANLEAPTVGGTYANLSWDAVLGAVYDIRYREVGNPTWTLIENHGASNYVLDGLFEQTDYEVQVRSECEGGGESGFSGSLFITTTVTSYCAAGSPDTQFEKISNVTFGSINNNSSSTAGYEDFTALETVIPMGQATAFSASISPSYPTDDIMVWIDLNQDGDFFDTGELVFTQTQSGGSVSGSITVPATAHQGATRMRVRLHDTSFVANGTPCGDSQYGQVEDYTVVLYSDYIYHANTWTPGNPDGIATTADGILIYDGTTTLLAATGASHLAVADGAQLLVQDVLTISQSLINKGSLVFESSATKTAALAAVPQGTLIMGPATVERFIPANRAFRFVSSAVSTLGPIRAHWQEGVNNTGTAFPGDNQNPNPGYGTHITGSQTGSNGFDATPSGNPSLFKVDANAQSFVAVGNTDATLLSAGEPYLLFVRGDRSINVTDNETTPTDTRLRATGFLAHGPITTPGFSPEAGHFNFFGNPYQSAVDMNTVMAQATNVNTNNYYVYDPSLGDRGQYVTVQLPSGTNTSLSNANQYLQPGQAAMVTTAANGAASLVFEEAAKAPGQHTQVFGPQPAPNFSEHFLIGRLYTTERFEAGLPLHDSFGIWFDGAYDTGVTVMDAVKAYNLDENMGRMHPEGVRLSLEQRAMPEADEILELISDQYRHTEYTLVVEKGGLEAWEVFLEDAFEGDSHPLENGSNEIPFLVQLGNPSSTAPNRFQFRFAEAVLETAATQAFDLTLYPNPIREGLLMLSSSQWVGQSLDISLRNLLGQEVFHTAMVAEAPEVRLSLGSRLPSGVYMLECAFNDRVLVRRVVVE